MSTLSELSRLHFYAAVSRLSSMLPSVPAGTFTLPICLAVLEVIMTKLSCQNTSGDCIERLL
jgi:hypothetical protein